jgi:hypothetical protein
VTRFATRRFSPLEFFHGREIAMSLVTTKPHFLRLAAYDSLDDERPLRWIGPVWPDTPLARQFFARVIRRYEAQNERNLGVLHSLGIFAWDGVLTAPPAAGDGRPVVRIQRRDDPAATLWVRLSDEQRSDRERFCEEFNSAYAASGLVASVG